MSYPSGAPGGYPGQPPQQPNPGFGGPQPGRPYGQPQQYGGGGSGFSLPPLKIAFLAVAALGVVNLFVGFADFAGSSCVGTDIRTCVSTSDSFYSGGLGWVPGLLAVAGLLALLTVLPGGNRDFKWGALVALANAGAVLPVLFTFWSSGDLGIGSVLIMIFAILQLVAAVGAYLLEAGIVTLPVRSAPPYAQPGGQYPNSGAFPPPGAQQHQPPQGGYYGNQPGQPGQPPKPPGQFGDQATQHVAPPPAKSTQFMQQPGQISQQPGTPPGGYGNG